MPNRIELKKTELLVIKESLEVLHEFYGSQVNYARSDEREDWLKKMLAVEEVVKLIHSHIERNIP